MIIDAQDRDGNGMKSSCFLTVNLGERGPSNSFVIGGYNWVSQKNDLTFFTMYEHFDLHDFVSLWQC